MKLFSFFKTYWAELVLAVGILVFAGYFSFFGILRMNTLYAHYFDLGIMHQTTFNTYRAFTTLDFSRILELTDPYGPEQITRPAIHNDIILALLAPFYVFHSGPETLIVLQAVIMALGAIPLFLTVKHLFRWHVLWRWLGLAICVAYLLYPASNYTVIFEFHGVALATTFLLAMFYFWLTSRYRWSFVFAVLAILTKEQVSATIAFFGGYIALSGWIHLWRTDRRHWKQYRPHWLSWTLLVLGVSWFLLSMKVIIPFFRGGSDHFALSYYADLGDSPLEVIGGLFTNPQVVLSYLTSQSALEYYYQMLFPLAYLPLLAPLVAAIAAPEYGIVLLSNSENLRNIIYHYSAVITPFLFLATVYAVYYLTTIVVPRVIRSARTRNLVVLALLPVVSIAVISTSLIAARTYGPLPFSEKANIHPFKYQPRNMADVERWAEELKDEELKIASTGKLGPFFTSRRYYYVMSDRYKLADYVVLNPKEVYNSYGSEWAIPGYEALVTDPMFEKIYDQNDIQVFRKIQ
jgi:uncharacterized membrane protein